MLSTAMKLIAFEISQIYSQSRNPIGVVFLHGLQLRVLRK